MSIINKLTHSVQRVTESMSGFDITLNCKSAMLKNYGSDTARIYFNGETSDYYVLESKDNISLNTDIDLEAIIETLKITFESTSNPGISILQQNKSIIS